MINPNVAVVLSGGGAFAAYEVGVMKAILGGETQATGYQPTDPGIYSGTSAGALNAAAMTSHADRGVLPALEALERIWLEDLAGRPGFQGNGVFHIRLNPNAALGLQTLTDPVSVLSGFARDAGRLAKTLVSRSSDLLFSTAPLASKVAGAFDLTDLISSHELDSTLRHILDLRAIGSSARQLRIAVTNWENGQARYFGNEELSKPLAYSALRASCAIPGIFPPVTIAGVNYADGGLVVNTPLKPAIDCGARVIHMIYLDPQVNDIFFARLENTLGIFQRSLAIAFAVRANQDLQIASWINEGLREPKHAHGKAPMATHTLFRTARDPNTSAHQELTIHRYRPRASLGTGLGVLDFSKAAIENLILQGYEDGMRHDCAVSECILPV